MTRLNDGPDRALVRLNLGFRDALSKRARVERAKTVQAVKVAEHAATQTDEVKAARARVWDGLNLFGRTRPRVKKQTSSSFGGVLGGREFLSRGWKRP